MSLRWICLGLMFEFSIGIVFVQIVIGCLLNAFEVGCGDPRIDLPWRALPLQENLLHAFVGCSLPDQLLDKEMILCDFRHFFRIPGSFELLNLFVDQLKYPPWAGLVAVDQEVFLAPVRDVPLVEPPFTLLIRTICPFFASDIWGRSSLSPSP